MSEVSLNSGSLKRVRARSWVMLALAGVAVLMLLAAGQRGADDGASELEARMERVLSSVEGAGRVKVMVLESGGEATGVLVVSEGAREAAVRLRLQNAVCTVLNIDNASISVVPMDDR